MATVFVVDDDRLTRQLLATLFQLEGYQVATDDDPARVLEKTRSAPPDALVIDCQLGDFDGVQLLEMIRSEPLLARAPIIMTSGIDRQDECFRAGANVFLMKPFRPDELIGELHHLLSASASQGKDER